MIDRDERSRRKAARGASSGSDDDMLRLERDIRAAGGGRWALMFEAREREESPPLDGAERATVTFDPPRPMRSTSHEVWIFPVATVAGLAEASGELARALETERKLARVEERRVYRVVAPRTCWILDRQRSEVMPSFGSDPIRAAFADDGRRPLYQGGYSDGRVLCIFCLARNLEYGPDDRRWRTRYVTLSEPAAGEGATSCGGCDRRVHVPVGLAAANELRIELGEAFWTDQRLSSNALEEFERPMAVFGLSDGSFVTAEGHDDAEAPLRVSEWDRGDGDFSASIQAADLGLMTREEARREIEDIIRALEPPD